MVSEQRRRARNREAGSGARWSLFVTLAGGMQELVDRIASRLPEGCVRLHTPIAGLIRDTDKNLWKVTTRGNESLEVDAVVLATPSFQTAETIGDVASSAANALKQITYASTATVSLAFRQKDFPRPLDSFGFVVPAIESRKIMACTFSSLKYPGRAPEGHVLLRAFVGGSLQPKLFQDDDATMEKHVRDELASLLGVVAQPVFSRVWRHPNSMPQYHVGHQSRIQQIEAQIAKFPSLALAGNAYHGVGIADCVRTGEEAAERIINRLYSL
jgi:protoporphyrinogen/coproporphyrinogen III oxidase